MQERAAKQEGRYQVWLGVRVSTLTGGGPYVEYCEQLAFETEEEARKAAGQETDAVVFDTETGEVIEAGVLPHAA